MKETCMDIMVIFLQLLYHSAIVPLPPPILELYRIGPWKMFEGFLFCLGTKYSLDKFFYLQRKRN